VAVRDVALIWSPEGVEPLASNLDRQTFPDLRTAITVALTAPDDAKRRPWLRAGTGQGSAILNYQGILLLQAAYEEGRADG